MPFLLSLLGPVLAKMPSLETLKLIAIGVAIVASLIGGFVLGYRWEAKAFADYKAKAEAHELALQQRYDGIANDESRAYVGLVTASQERTERELEALKNAPPIPAPPALPGKRKRAPVADDDSARTVRVLRDAFAR